ncbi:helix-turn-helix transcriptional regulator [Neptunomonas phycophila]|uniref:helix-turn-helix transcriptional regulator n=1 Tax=Neptunomonas phycophila TaxID=1572645 RepID=UPI000948CF9B|nr:WYL domain-containing protein [Neptunomonas phycophila]
MLNSNGPLRYNEKERYRVIELFALWEGRVNTTHLQNVFGIGRQKASEIIGSYTQRYPQNLDYNASAKGYQLTDEFTPWHAGSSFDEYYHLLTRAGHNDYLSFLQTGFSLLEAPLRNISPALVQPIIKAIREKRRLDIGYASVSSPEYESRIISPHCLVFDGIRWHVRAWCEKNQQYRDFVLSRFSGEFEFEGPSEHTAEDDERWNTWLDIVIEPDPRLSPAKKRIIAMDYQMENNQRIIPLRAALVLYVWQRLRLDHYAQDPEAQQITITPESHKAIKPYLP